MKRQAMLFLLFAAVISLNAQDYECGVIQSHRIEMTKSYDKLKDEEAAEILSPYKAPIDSVVLTKVGESEMLMSPDRPESLLSNWVADVYVTEAKKMGEKVDFAVCNIGGLRSDMPKGDVLKGNIMNIAPFTNYFTFLEMKGEDVLELFGQIAHSKGEGVSKEVKIVISADGNLIDAKIGGKPIKPNKTYKIATLSFLADGNDKMEAFKKAKNRVDRKEVVQDILLDFVTDEYKAGRKLTSALDGRITVEGNTPSLSHYEESRAIELTIVHTNDTHSCIEPLDPNSANKQIADKGGYVRRSGLLKFMREDDPEILLVDCGDFSQGSAYYTLYKGEVEVKLMNHMGYDAATIGNHEFDFGIDNMVRIFKMANFPIVCCNYDFGSTALKDIVKPYTIVYKKGIKIGLFGVCPKMEGLVSKENYEGITFMNPIDCANQVAATLKNQEKCDLVVCVSHLGWNEKELGGPSEDNQIWDQNLIANTRNIDVVVGGHSHTYFQHPETVKNLDGKPIICNQMGKNAQYVGTLTIEMKKKKKKEEGK